jgi:HSP20 family protein
LQRSINRVFDDRTVGRPKGQEAREVIWAPPVSTYEDKNAYVLFCDLPGIAQKDVKLNIDKNILTLSGTRKLAQEDNRENYVRIESPFGTFNRSFVLPDTVQTEKVEASMEKGILRIQLPKRDQSVPKEIKIKNK